MNPTPTASARRADDAELLATWRQGDPHSGQALFGRHFTRISRFFRGKVDANFIDDLVQETFFRCVRGRGRVRDGEAFRSYLFGVAYNTLREHYRDRVREADIDFGVTSVHDLATSPSERVDRNDRRRALHRQLQCLPVDQQVALELYYWEGMTAPAVASAMGIPEGTARTRIRRGKLRLQQLLQAAALEAPSGPGRGTTNVGRSRGWPSRPNASH